MYCNSIIGPADGYGWKYVITGVPVLFAVLVVFIATFYACYIICCGTQKETGRYCKFFQFYFVFLYNIICPNVLIKSKEIAMASLSFTDCLY